MTGRRRPVTSSQMPARPCSATQNDAFWRFGYLGTNIDYKYPGAADPNKVTDAELRASLPNWGFHNNLWLRTPEGSIARPLTDSDTFKWLGSWSSDGAWLSFAELVATEGEVFDFGGALAFDAKTMIDLSVLSPEANQLTRITSSGDLETFAWQPLPPPPSAAATQRARAGLAGNFAAPQLSVVPDGRFDEWSGPWESLLADVQGADQRSGVEDLSARFRTAWDSRGLYLAVQVTDDSYVAAPPGEGMAVGDSIEINLDRDLAGDFDDPDSSADDYRIGISFGKKGEGVPGYRWLPAGGKGPLSLTAAVVPTQGGYDLEALIPWEAFDLAGMPVGDGAAYGFNLAINDYDMPEGTLPTILSTSPGRTAPDNPRQWGTLRLAAPARLRLSARGLLAGFYRPVQTVAFQCHQSNAVPSPGIAWRRDGASSGYRMTTGRNSRSGVPTRTIPLMPAPPGPPWNWQK